MFVICSLLLTIKAGNINIVQRSDVEGRLLKEGSNNYLVDFREGVKKFNLAGKPEDYNKVLIKKTECIKE